VYVFNEFAGGWKIIGLAMIFCGRGVVWDWGRCNHRWRVEVCWWVCDVISVVI